jgi:hypothetical protein
MPQLRKRRVEFGVSCRPAPISRREEADSRIVILWDGLLREVEMAAERPARPQPIIVRWSGGGGGFEDMVAVLMQAAGSRDSING